MVGNNSGKIVVKTKKKLIKKNGGENFSNKEKNSGQKS